MRNRPFIVSRCMENDGWDQSVVVICSHCFFPRTRSICIARFHLLLETKLWGRELTRLMINFFLFCPKNKEQSVSHSTFQEGGGGYGENDVICMHGGKKRGTSRRALRRSENIVLDVTKPDSHHSRALTKSLTPHHDRKIDDGVRWKRSTKVCNNENEYGSAG